MNLQYMYVQIRLLPCNCMYTVPNHKFASKGLSFLSFSKRRYCRYNAQSTESETLKLWEVDVTVIVLKISVLVDLMILIVNNSNCDHISCCAWYKCLSKYSRSNRSRLPGWLSWMSSLLPAVVSLLFKTPLLTEKCRKYLSI